MATPQTWHPWREMRRLQHEMEHILGDLGPDPSYLRTSEYPPLNVTRADQGITVEALCPGTARASLDVSVSSDALTIRGERKPEPEVRDEQYHRRERLLGSFTRTVSIGERLDPDRTTATYTNGILRVRLTRAPETAPKKVPIQS